MLALACEVNMARSTRLKGYRVTRKGSKVILEPIPCYGLNASARIRQRKSKVGMVKVKVVHVENGEG